MVTSPKMIRSRASARKADQVEQTVEASVYEATLQAMELLRAEYKEAGKPGLSGSLLAMIEKVKGFGAP